MFLYHIPMYHLPELPGEKNPSSNTSSEETRVFPFVRFWVAVKVSTEMAIVGNKMKIIKKRFV